MKYSSKSYATNLDNYEQPTSDERDNRSASLSPNLNYSTKKMALRSPMWLLAMLLLNGVHGELCFECVFIESRLTRSVNSQKRVILQVANYAARVH